MKRKLALAMLPAILILFLSVGSCVAIPTPPVPTPDTIEPGVHVDDMLSELFFGSVWYFGFLIYLGASLAVLKLWKYAGAILIPLCFAFEVQYYNRLALNPEMVWAMLLCGFFVMTIAIYTAMALGSKKGKE